MELTYNGSYGGLLHPEVENPGHGIPDLSSINQTRGLDVLGTYAGREREVAELDAWKPRAFAAAARDWDFGGTSYLTRNSPNPWLGENPLPAPGQPHPLK